MTSPANALDPAIMLATGVHAQPGVYALLLGSGVSSGAGIPTGWGVVKELIRRAAAAQAPDYPDAAIRAADDPEAWRAAHGDGELLGYSNLWPLSPDAGGQTGTADGLLRAFRRRRAGRAHGAGLDITPSRPSAGVA